MPDASSSRFDLDDARSVLVVKPSSLGDVIHTLPAVTHLSRHRPDLQIDWVVNTEWAPLLAGNPALRRVISMPRREWRGWRDLPKAKRWAKETLGPLRPDLVLDFQGLLRSGLLAKASGGAHRVGFRRAREGASLFYDQKVEVANWESTHAVDRYLALVRAVGVPPLPENADPVEWFPLPPGDRVKLPESVDPERPFLLLHPFSRGRGKSMNFSECAAFCRCFRELAGIPVLLVGAGFSWPSSGKPLPDGVIDLLNATSLAQLVWLMRRARFTVSVDSGPMHLAAALTGDLLSLHTWTDPRMVGPWRGDAWIWRDGVTAQVRDVEPGRFPEDRNARERYAGGILPDETTADALAAFVSERVKPAQP